MNSSSKVIVSKRHLKLDNIDSNQAPSSRSTINKEKRISLGGLTAGLRQREQNDATTLGFDSRQNDLFAKTWGPAFHSSHMSTTKCSSVKVMDETLKSQILNSVHSKLSQVAAANHSSRNGLSKYLSNPATTTTFHSAATNRQSSPPSQPSPKHPRGSDYKRSNQANLQIGVRKSSLQQILNKQGAAAGGIKKVQQIEMVTSNHKRVITQAGGQQITHPPFSMKNLILAQATSNYNTITSGGAGATRNTLESAIYSALNQPSTKSQGLVQNRFQFRKSIDNSNKTDFVQLIQRNHQPSTQIITSPSHRNGVKRQSQGGNAPGEKTASSRNTYTYGSSQHKPLPQYLCETGASLDHKISPLLSQNSMISNSQKHHQAAPEQPTVTNRPLSNLTALNQTSAVPLGSNLFNFMRPSFDRSAIIAMNRSEKIDKRMQATNPQSKKRVASSSSSEDLYSSDEENMVMNEEGALTKSQIDTLATASLVEGTVGIRLPMSQIPVCKLLPSGFITAAAPAGEESKDSAASQKTTERNYKPFGRPGQHNQPLIVHNILAQTCSPKKLKQRIDQLKITKSTLLDGTAGQNNISTSGIPVTYISRSRSQSPKSDVEAEYFQAGASNNGKQPTTKKLIEKALGGQEFQNNFLPLLEGYSKKGDLQSLQSFINSEKHLLPKIIESIKILLYKVIEFNHPALLKYLLTCLQGKTTENYNLLHITCRQSNNHNISLFKYILVYDSKASLNQQDTYGNTPVHLCAQGGKIEVMKYFFKEHLPDITIINSEGKTPMHYGISNKASKVFAGYIKRLTDAKHPSVKQIHKLLNSDEDLKPLQKLIKSGGTILKKDRSQGQLLNINEECKMSERLVCKRQKENIALNSNRMNIDRCPSKTPGFSEKRVSSGGGFSYKPCETEPSLSSRFIFQTQESQKVDKVNIDSNTPDDDDFDSDDLQVIDAPLFIEDDKSQTLQFCEQIEEVSEESLRQSIIGAQAGDKIGAHSFEPMSLIGKGSFGEVYLVRKKDSNYEQLFAMKVLQKEKILGQNLVKYAVTERHVLSITKHPFIVGLNYAFQTRDKLFLILDYCPGGDLGKVIAREKRLTEERARIYLSEILLALENLHERDIIFRDLKPDNVVLDAEGHALLTDFGLSKVGVLDNLGAKSFCGSIAYLAPEMLKRTGHGKSVDWYLLGVLFYEMVVGIPPYFTNNREKIFQNIQRGPLLMPTQLTKPAQDLIVKLLCKNPLKRLGAGIRDAEEIKEHQFFEGVDWDKVYKREMKPPKPEIRKVKPLHPSEMISYAQILTKNEGPKHKKGQIQEQPNRLTEDDNNLPGWSFVTPAVVDTAATQ